MTLIQTYTTIFDSYINAIFGFAFKGTKNAETESEIWSGLVKFENNSQKLRFEKNFSVVKAQLKNSVNAHSGRGSSFVVYNQNSQSRITMIRMTPSSTPNTSSDDITGLKSPGSGKNTIISLHSNGEQQQGSSSSCSDSDSDDWWTEDSSSEEENVDEASLKELNKFRFGSQDDSYHSENNTLDESQNDNIDSSDSKSFFVRDLTEELLNFCKDYEGTDSGALDSLLNELEAPRYTFADEMNDHSMLTRLIKLQGSEYGPFSDLPRKYEMQASSKRLAILEKVQVTIQNIEKEKGIVE